jgi:hypothetical protein
MTFTTEDRVNAEKFTCKYQPIKGRYDTFWETDCNQLIATDSVEQNPTEPCAWCNRPIFRIFE